MAHPTNRRESVLEPILHEIPPATHTETGLLLGGVFLGAVGLILWSIKHQTGLGPLNIAAIAGGGTSGMLILSKVGLTANRRWHTAPLPASPLPTAPSMSTTSAATSARTTHIVTPSGPSSSSAPVVTNTGTPSNLPPPIAIPLPKALETLTSNSVSLPSAPVVVADRATPDSLPSPIAIPLPKALETPTSNPKTNLASLAHSSVSEPKSWAELVAGVDPDSELGRWLTTLNPETTEQAGANSTRMLELYKALHTAMNEGSFSEKDMWEIYNRALEGLGMAYQGSFAEALMGQAMDNPVILPTELIRHLKLWTSDTIRLGHHLLVSTNQYVYPSNSRCPIYKLIFSKIPNMSIVGDLNDLRTVLREQFIQQDCMDNELENMRAGFQAYPNRSHDMIVFWNATMPLSARIPIPTQ